MSDKTNPRSLQEKKLRFHFSDGPMKGKAFDHVFHRDGTVSWGPEDGDVTKSENASVEKIGDGSFIGSYLGPKGYTLTTAFNLTTGDLVAFSSDGKNWSKQHGRAELLDT